MTPRQLDRIPDNLLAGRDTTRLTTWLHERGWRMTLLELDAERRRRGIAALTESNPNRQRTTR
jgi:hypothetical protein